MLVKILPLILLAGCAGTQVPSFTEADMHKAKCTAKGEVVIALTPDDNEAELRLQNLAAQDVDCKAVFAGHPVKVVVSK